MRPAGLPAWLASQRRQGDMHMHACCTCACQASRHRSAVAVPCHKAAPVQVGAIITACNAS